MIRNLDFLVAAPAVDGQGPGHVERTADAVGQDIPERLAGRAERDSADEAAIAAAQLDPHMPAAADLPRLDDPMLREHEDRLGLP